VPILKNRILLFNNL
jgi:hypothetical protein